MSRLVQWLDHRMEVMEIDTEKELSRLTGITTATLGEVREVGSLEILNRSQRRGLAAALRVSLRRLEQLDSDVIDWIDDHDVYDVGGSTRPRPGQEEGEQREVPPPDPGTPLIGRVRSTGQVDLDEDWQPQWGKYIPPRFGKGNQVFALETESGGRAVVLRLVAPWELCQGTGAVYCWNGWEAQGWFGDVCLEPKTYVVTPDGRRHELDLLSIVCIGRIVARWPNRGGAA